MSRNALLLLLIVFSSSYSPARIRGTQASAKRRSHENRQAFLRRALRPRGNRRGACPETLAGSWSHTPGVKGRRGYRDDRRQQPGAAGGRSGRPVGAPAKVESEVSVNHPVRREPARLREREYCWKVRVWDHQGTPSPWSAPAAFSTGLLSRGDWKGKWIGLDGIDTAYHLTATNWIWYPEGSPEKSAPLGTRYFRRTLDLPAAFAGARVHITGDNECTIFVNGTEVHRSDNLRIVPDVDVRDHLHPGVNVLAVSVKNVGGGPNPAGLVGVMEIRHADGTSERITTDSAWKSSEKEIPGWQGAAFDDGGWVHAKIIGPAGMQPWGEMYGEEDRRLTRPLAQQGVRRGEERGTRHGIHLRPGTLRILHQRRKSGAATSSPPPSASIRSARTT
jgi:hypothetical protein